MDWNQSTNLGQTCERLSLSVDSELDTTSLLDSVMILWIFTFFLLSVTVKNETWQLLKKTASIFQDAKE